MNLIDKQDIIDTNEKIIDNWNLAHPEDQQFLCVRSGVLEEVFEIVDKIGGNLDTKENLILKVSYLMGAISWAQPFCDGNKRTATLITFFIFDEHELRFEPYDEDMLIDLLYEIQEERVELNQDTIDKIILYISKSVK